MHHRLLISPTVMRVPVNVIFSELFLPRITVLFTSSDKLQGNVSIISQVKGLAWFPLPLKYEVKMHSYCRLHKGGVSKLFLAEGI